MSCEQVSEKGLSEEGIVTVLMGCLHLVELENLMAAPGISILLHTVLSSVALLMWIYAYWEFESVCQTSDNTF